MKLAELQPEFLRYEGEDGKLMHVGEPPDVTLEQADAIMFLCPKCFGEKGGAAEVRADTIFDRLAEERYGCSIREPDAYLLKHGYAWQLAYRCGPPGNTFREVWPPAPWADVHICEVRVAAGYHSVVLLRDGTVLDPACDAPRRLANYLEVVSVSAHE